MNEGDKPAPGHVVEPSSSETEKPRQQGPKPDRQPDSASTPWQFKADDNAAERPRPTSQPSSVSWTASEFIAHDKASGWYGLLALGGALGAAIIYLLTRDIITTGMIIIVTVLFGVFAARKPRVLDYGLDGSGIHIGQKFYPYGDFKSFSVIDEGSISGIWLMPLRRFMPNLTIYYAPDDEDKILNVLSQYLPFEDRQHDMVDRFLRKVRF